MKNKNRYHQITAAAVAALILTGCEMTEKYTPLAQSALTDDKPNVLLITVDSLGSADISAKGAEFNTPNIDRLLSEGVTLNRFYSASQSSGTQAALLTARDPHELGISYAELYPWSPGALAPTEFLLSESLQNAGYQTALIGKWHLGSQTSRHHPNNRGYDYFFGHLNGQVDYFQHTSARGKDIQENGQSKGNAYDNIFGPELISSAAVHWLSQSQKPESSESAQPFFLHVSYKAPRAPLQAPDHLIQKMLETHPDMTKERATYAAMAQSVDKGIGELLSVLKDKKMRENTLVIFLSTNGGDLKNGASNGPLRGGRLSGYEGGVRSLAIMSGLGLPEGSTTNQVLSAVDLYPTINEATGTTNGAPRTKAELQDGISYWSNLLNGSVSPHDMIYIAAEGEQGMGNRFNFSIIKDDYKVVRHVDRSYKGISIRNELYNLSDDPSETTNLAEQEPERLNQLLSGFIDWRKKHVWTGNHYEPTPIPGWVAPTDWALRMQQRDLTASQEVGDNVFGFIAGESLKSLDSFIYQRAEVGTIIYQ